MNGWRPELTAATADSDALTRPGLRVVPPPAAHARAGRGGFSRGRVRTLFAADIVAILVSLAATYVLEEHGAQSHRYTLEEFIERFRKEFGDWDELEKLETRD